MTAKARKPATARRRTPDPGVLDLEHLRRYTMDSPELERELIGLFVAQLPDLTSQLKSADCLQDWRLATHTLKGSARVIGAPAIADVAAELEREGLACDPACKTRLMVALEDAVSAFLETARRLHR